MSDSDIITNIKAVQQRITAARNQPTSIQADAIQLIAVSKTRPIESLLAAHQCGLIHFGENYLQEALTKIQQLSNYPLVWHFIGHIQSNKTTEIAQNFDWVQTVDRVKIAERLNKQRPNDKPPLNVLIQVNIDEEPSKSGVSAEQVVHLAKAITKLPKLCLRGLMSIPAVQTVNSHQHMYQLFTQLQQLFPTVDTLSMGMSGDLETAIHSGSNMVRIGTDIFGARTMLT